MLSSENCQGQLSCKLLCLASATALPHLMNASKTNVSTGLTCYGTYTCCSIPPAISRLAVRSTCWFAGLPLCHTLFLANHSWELVAITGCCSSAYSCQGKWHILCMSGFQMTVMPQLYHIPAAVCLRLEASATLHTCLAVKAAPK